VGSEMFIRDWCYAPRTMPGLLSDLDAFLQEHRRCGVLDDGVEDGRVWMSPSHPGNSSAR
jgi:hypothetical protein